MYFLAWICLQILVIGGVVKKAQRSQKKRVSQHFANLLNVRSLSKIHLSFPGNIWSHGVCCHLAVKQLVSARNIIYFTDKKEEDLHIEFNMYVWKLHILFHNVLAPKNNQVTEQVNRAKIRDKINNDSEWIFLQVFISAIANPLQTIICRSHKLCDYDVQPIFQ